MAMQVQVQSLQSNSRKVAPGDDFAGADNKSANALGCPPCSS
jgi:hypothetical protein